MKFNTTLLYFATPLFDVTVQLNLVGQADVVPRKVTRQSWSRDSSNVPTVLDTDTHVPAARHDGVGGWPPCW